MAITLAFQARDEGSIPFTRSTLSSKPPFFSSLFLPISHCFLVVVALFFYRAHQLGEIDSVGWMFRVPIPYKMGLTQGQTHGEVCDGDRD